jgi:type IV pilus assembly protein PilA
VQPGSASRRSIALAIVIAIIGGIAMIGIIAAVAVPGLLRARMAGNEASATGSLNAINTAQRNFSQQCNGYSADLPTLASAGPYLSPDLTRGVTVTRVAM